MGTLKVNSIEPISGDELIIGGNLKIEGDVVLQPTPTPSSTSPQNLYNSSCCVLVSSFCGIEVSCAGQLENGRPTYQFTFNNGESGIIIWYPQYSLSPTGSAWVLWDFPQTTQLAYLPINSTSPIGGIKNWVWVSNNQSLCLTSSSTFQTLPYNQPCPTSTPTSSFVSNCTVLDISHYCGTGNAIQTGLLNGRPFYTYSFGLPTSPFASGIIYWDPILSWWIVEENSNSLPPGRIMYLPTNSPYPISGPGTPINRWIAYPGLNAAYFASCYFQPNIIWPFFDTDLSSDPCPTPTPTPSPFTGNTQCGTGYEYIQQDTVMFSNGQVVITEMINGVETAIPGPNGLESTNFKIYINTVDADNIELKPYFESLIEGGNDVYLELCQNGDKAVYRITANSFVIQTEGLYSYMYTPRTSGTITQISYSSNDFVFDGDRSIIIDLDPIIPASPTPTPTITRTPIPSCGAGCYYYKLKNNTASSVTFSYVDCLGNVITTQTNTAPYGTMFVCANARGITYYTQPWQLSYPQPILTWEVVGCCPTPTPTLTPTITKTPTRTPQPTFCSGNCYNYTATLNPGQTFAQITYIRCGASPQTPPVVEYLYISGLTATTFCCQDIVGGNQATTYSAITLTNLGCCPTPTPTPTPTITRTPQPTPCSGNCYNVLVSLKPNETFGQVAYIPCGWSPSSPWSVIQLYISGVTATTFCSQDIVGNQSTTFSALTFTNLGCCPSSTPTPTATPTPTNVPCAIGFNTICTSPNSSFMTQTGSFNGRPLFSGFISPNEVFNVYWSITLSAWVLEFITTLGQTPLGIVGQLNSNTQLPISTTQIPWVGTVPIPIGSCFGDQSTFGDLIFETYLWTNPCPTRTSTPTPTPTITRTPQTTPCSGVCSYSLVVLHPGETFAQITYIGCGAITPSTVYLYSNGVTATTFCSQDLIQGLTTMSAITFTTLGCCPTPTATSQPTPTPTPTSTVGFVPPTPTPTVTSTSTPTLTPSSTVTPTVTRTSTPTSTVGFVPPTPTPTVTSTSTPEPTNPQLCTCYDQTIYISSLDLAGAIGNDNEELNGKVFVDYINCGDLASTTISFTDEGTYNSVICVSTTNQSKVNVYYYNYNVIIGKGVVSSFVESSSKCCSIEIQPPDPEA